MPLHPHILVALLCVGGTLPVEAADRTAPARLCPEDAPEGVRLPPRAGCAGQAQRRDAVDAQGFRDVGGVKLRIGGRVGAEFGVAR